MRRPRSWLAESLTLAFSPEVQVQVDIGAAVLALYWLRPWPLKQQDDLLRMALYQ
jgi:hypothetical protein